MMKKHNIRRWCLSLALLMLGSAMTVSAAQAEGGSPMKVWGNVQNKEGSALTLMNQKKGGYEGEFILHLSEDTRLLNAVTGMPVTMDAISEGEMIYAYTMEAVTASLPPQSGATVVLAEIPADGKVPAYVQVQEIEKRPGGYQLAASDGTGYWIPDHCMIVPYLTRNMLYLENLYKGASCLIWADGDGKAERIMMFPPYASEEERAPQAGWKLEGGTAGTETAVWMYKKEDGTSFTGWLEDEGKWYYLNPETGVMEQGFQRIDGKTYYFLKDGSMLTEARTFVPDQNGALR